jgi:hypothetical protein
MTDTNKKVHHPYTVDCDDVLYREKLDEERANWHEERNSLRLELKQKQEEILRLQCDEIPDAKAKGYQEGQEYNHSQVTQLKEKIQKYADWVSRLNTELSVHKKTAEVAVKRAFILVGTGATVAGILVGNRIYVWAQNEGLQLGIERKEVEYKPLLEAEQKHVRQLQSALRGTEASVRSLRGKESSRTAAIKEEKEAERRLYFSTEAVQERQFQTTVTTTMKGMKSAVNSNNRTRLLSYYTDSALTRHTQEPPFFSTQEASIGLLKVRSSWHKVAVASISYEPQEHVYKSVMQVTLRIEGRDPVTGKRIAYGYPQKTYEHHWIRVEGKYKIASESAPNNKGVIRISPDIANSSMVSSISSEGFNPIVGLK